MVGSVLAMRKQCARDIGMYDPEAKKAEDMELCFRLARNEKWLAVREVDVYVRHKARKTMGGLLRQLWGWGYHSGLPYRKTGFRGVYLHWVDSQRHWISHALEIGRFPILVCMFISDWHLFVLALLVAVGALAGGLFLLGAVSLAASAYFCWRSAWDVRSLELPLGSSLQIYATHTLASLVFCAAFLVGGLRRGVVILPGPMLRVRGPK